MTKERPAEDSSYNPNETIEEFAERMEKLEQERKEMTPNAPDESGEIGTYDEDASNWLGGYIYKTASGRYFSLLGGNELKFLSGTNFETYLKKLEKRKK